MKRTVKQLENCRTEVAVTFEAKEWKDAQAEAFKKIAQNVEVKGFRKGHVPENILKGHIDQVKVLHQAMETLLGEAYESILSEEKIEPFAQPKINVTKMSDNECEIQILFVTRPEVKLGNYKGLTIGHNEVKVSEKEVDEEVNRRLLDHAELVLKETAVAVGDTVVLDFEGFVDGVAFEGGKAENYSLEIGSKSFVPGFEEQLVGLVAGDKKDITVTFPEQYPAANLAGKETVFKTAIHEVKEKKVPELTDASVAGLDIKDCTTVAQLKEIAKADLMSQKDNEEKGRYFNALVDEITKNATISLPEEIVADEVEATVENLSNEVKQKGLEMKQYLELTNQTLEDVKAKMSVEATRNIKNFFVLDAIAKVEEITVDDAILELEIAKIADQYKMEIEKVREIVLKDKKRFADNIRREQLNQLLLKNNN